jgi:hypothetical protein
MSQSPTTQEDEGATPNINTCGAYAVSGLASGRLSFTPAEPVYPEGNEPSTAEVIKAAYPEIAAVAGWAEKIVVIAGLLEIADPGWLANVMFFESSLNPAATNKSFGCTGLIQFCPNSGAEKVGKTTDELRRMGAIEQMDYVYAYLREYRGRMNSSADLYMAIFFPVAVGKGPNYSIYNWYLTNKGATSAARYLEANLGIRTSGDYQAFADRRARLPTALRTEAVASL